LIEIESTKIGSPFTPKSGELSPDWPKIQNFMLVLEGWPLGLLADKDISGKTIAEYNKSKDPHIRLCRQAVHRYMTAPSPIK
jgi:hypothetical protein